MMTNIKVKVEVKLKAGVHDPQGETIKHALANLGYSGIKQITTGKVFTIVLDAESEAAAREAAKIYADKLLANPVIEEFKVETIA
jgi:phosphoribosylformylglycinamidine synthase subunit PurS